MQIYKCGFGISRISFGHLLFIRMLFIRMRDHFLKERIVDIQKVVQISGSLVKSFKNTSLCIIKKRRHEICFFITKQNQICYKRSAISIHQLFDW